jgi:hypothetical protein
MSAPPPPSGSTADPVESVRQALRAGGERPAARRGSGAPEDSAQQGCRNREVEAIIQAQMIARGMRPAKEEPVLIEVNCESPDPPWVANGPSEEDAAKIVSDEAALRQILGRLPGVDPHNPHFQTLFDTEQRTRSHVRRRP